MLKAIQSGLFGCAILAAVASGCKTSQGQGKIKAEGGTVDVRWVAKVNVPPGALEREAEVSARREAPTHESQQAFAGAAALFRIVEEAPQQVVVSIDGQQPQAPIEVELSAPVQFRKRVTHSSVTDENREDTRLRVFAQNVWTATGTEAGRRLVTFEPLAQGEFFPATRKLKVSVPPHAFATRDGKAEAVLRVGVVPDQAPITSRGIPGELAMQAFGIKTPDEKTSGCEGLALGPPLRGDYMQVQTFGFDPRAEPRGNRFYPGVDYVSARGERDVLAMSGGRVVHVGTQRDEKGSIGGWGHHLIVDQTGDGAGPFVLYAHLDPKSTRSMLGKKVNRGDVIAKVAGNADNTGAQGEASTLHVELVSRNSAIGKTDPQECLSAAYLEYLVAGYRAGTIILAPDVDSDSQSIELRGSDADQVWWPGGAKAQVSFKHNNRMLHYASNANGEVGTLVSDNGLRVLVNVNAGGEVRGKLADADVPANAVASGSGGARVRFRVVRSATYRLMVRYDVKAPGEWAIDTRLRAAGKDAAINADFDNMQKTGDAPAQLSKVFEGRLAQPGVYEFDFLPSANLGGGASRTARIDARAILEVLPEGQGAAQTAMAKEE